MKTVYSLPYCPGCVTLKNQLKSSGEPFKEVMINKDITLQEFQERFPSVRTVPYVVEEDDQS
jgi:glutaredoxin